MQVPFHAVKVGQIFIRAGHRTSFMKLNATVAKPMGNNLGKYKSDADELVHVGKIADADFALEFLQRLKAQKDLSGVNELRIDFTDEFGFTYRFGATEQSAFIQEFNRTGKEVTGWQHFRSVAHMADEYGLSWVLED